MKLNGPKRSFAMSESHNEIVFGPRGHAQTIRNRLRDDQRVIAHGREFFRNPCEEFAAVMVDDARPSVDRFGCTLDSPAENVSHSLKSEADAKYGDTRFEQYMPADAEV